MEGRMENVSQIDEYRARAAAAEVLEHKIGGPGPVYPEDITEMAARVDAAGPVAYLIEPLWPADAYGVLAATDKAGKTWAALDFAVSVATGGAWFGRFPAKEGRALVYCGEGGARNIVRRMRAIAEHKTVPFDDLAGSIRVSERAPNLKSDEAIQRIREELFVYPSSIVIIEPLYLAAPGAKGSDLYAMAEVFGPIQAACQEVGSALMFTTHWTKTGIGTGAQRMTGVGPGAWGRVLGSGNVVGSRTHRDGRSEVDIAWEFTGGEIPETKFQVRREVWAYNPSDLASPLHYRTEVIEGFALLAQRPPSEAQVLDALTARAPERMTRKQLEEVTGLHQQTVKGALASLEASDMIEKEVAGRNIGLYWVEPPATAPVDQVEQ
jgi:hypothetical protein